MPLATRTSEGGERDSVALEEKARRLLKRCRYDEASSAFKEALQRQEAISPPSSAHAVRRKIATLEHLAVCQSRLLE